MTALYLLRHGRTEWTGHRYCGRSDPPLDAAGRSEARRAARRLRRLVSGGARLIASPLARARQTACAIDAAYAVDARLVEVDFGRADGLTFAELGMRFPNIAATLLTGGIAVDWPDGERWHDVRARAASFCADVRSSEVVVVVTHGFIAHAILDLVAHTPVREGLSPGGVVSVEL